MDIDMLRELVGEIRLVRKALEEISREMRRRDARVVQLPQFQGKPLPPHHPPRSDPPEFNLNLRGKESE